MGYLKVKKQYNSFSQASENFDDGKFSKGDPIGIEVKCGDVVDAISFIYKDTEKVTHGGTGGGLHTIEFAENEYLTKIDLKYGTWYNSYKAVLEITFTTNLNKIYNYGNFKKLKGTTVSYYFSKKPITAIVGKTISIPSQNNKFIADLGVYYVDKFC